MDCGQSFILERSLLFYRMTETRWLWIQWFDLNHHLLRSSACRHVGGGRTWILVPGVRVLNFSSELPWCDLCSTNTRQDLYINVISVNRAQSWCWSQVLKTVNGWMSFLSDPCDFCLQLLIGPWWGSLNPQHTLQLNPRGQTHLYFHSQSILIVARAEWTKVWGRLDVSAHSWKMTWASLLRSLWGLIWSNSQTLWRWRNVSKVSKQCEFSSGPTSGGWEHLKKLQNLQEEPKTTKSF